MLPGTGEGPGGRIPALAPTPGPPAMPGAYGIIVSAPAGREDPACENSASALGTASLRPVMVSATMGDIPGNTAVSSFEPCSIMANPVTASCCGEPPPGPPGAARFKRPGLAGIPGGGPGSLSPTGLGRTGGVSSRAVEGLTCPGEFSKAGMAIYSRLSCCWTFCPFQNRTCCLQQGLYGQGPTRGLTSLSGSSLGSSVLEELRQLLSCAARFTSCGSIAAVVYLCVLLSIVTWPLSASRRAWVQICGPCETKFGACCVLFHGQQPGDPCGPACWCLPSFSPLLDESQRLQVCDQSSQHVVVVGDCG